MSEEMKYPAFYESNSHHQVVLAYSPSLALHTDGEFKGEASERYDVSRAANITHEYLKETWGVVESKEHAEFIVELAENAGFKFFDVGNSRKFFYFNSSEILFSEFKRFIPSVDTRKEITIPLPPKTKEWTPEVGDEVCWSNWKRKGELKSICDGWAWIKDDSGEFISLMAKYIKKPKSAQELKIEELQTKLCENNAVDNYILACDIVMGNIEGLSYDRAD